MNLVSVQVPIAEAADLDQLANSDSGSEASEIQPFDGEVWSQVIVALTGATTTILVTWIKSRVAARRTFRVVIDGIAYSGYTAAEVANLLLAVDARAN